MIALDHISKIFNKGMQNEVIALQDISLQIQEGEFVIMIGSNGSGKTTLLNCIAGAIKPSSGSIVINGNKVNALPEYKRSQWVARVFQNPNNGTAPDLSILDNFRLAALRTQQKGLRIGTHARFKKEVAEKVATLGMGLENKLSQNMGNLSGGQRQALTLLMSVMDETHILLLDEPTAALDPKSAALILNLAEKLNRDLHMITLLVTHNIKDAHRYGNRIIQMQEGKIKRDLSKKEKEALTVAGMYDWFG